MKGTKKVFWVLLLAAFSAVGGCGVPPAGDSIPSGTSSLQSAPTIAQQDAPSVQELADEHNTITLVAAGDNLIHDVIYNQARERDSGGSYNFTPAYSEVAPIIRAADIAVINQETMLASDVAEVSSYPRFCSPTVLGEQLMEVGFDVFTQANNHSYDKGAAGIRACMDFWDAHPAALAVGLYRDAAEKEQINYTEIEGIKIAFLAATEQTNGLTLSAEATEGVWMLSEAAGLEKQIAEARENADLVVVSAHWGVEGADEPSQEQQQMANRLVQWGADLVLGTHPHVLQPCQIITRADGTQGLVVYSLGNFISAQRGAGNMAGGLMEVTIGKEGDSHAKITAHRFIPTVTQYGGGYGELKIVPFDGYTPAMAQSHGVRRYAPDFNMDYLTRIYRDTYPDCAVLQGNLTTVIETSQTAESVPQPSPTTAPLTVRQPDATATDEEMDALCKKYNVVGMSVAAFREEQVVYTHSYGLSNVEKNIPAGEDTFYRTASIAKPITAMVALQLLDDGIIDLDSDISQYIGFPVHNPKYPDNIITTRLLMTHTASVIDSGAYYDAIGHTPFSGLSSLMKHNVFSPYPPGAIYIYSNLSAGMVGCVAQGAAKEHLWSLAERRLFTPLDISATYLSKTIADQGKIAHIYSNGEKTFNPITDGTAESYYKRIPPGEMYMLGHGDLYITAADLARLGMVLAGDGQVGTTRILKEDTVKAMNSLQFHVAKNPDNGIEIFRGLEIQLLPEMLPGMDFAGHQGNAYGMMGCLLYQPEKGTGVAFLTNGCHTGQRDGVVYDINRDITEAIYKPILTPR